MLTSRVNYRNHRKICVIDGEVGFIGGMNIAKRYVKGTGKQAWRDTHVEDKGGGSCMVCKGLSWWIGSSYVGL